MYEEAAKKSQASGGQKGPNAEKATGSQAPGPGKDETVVDADYEVVDDEGDSKKKKP